MKMLYILGLLSICICYKISGQENIELKSASLYDCNAKWRAGFAHRHNPYPPLLLDGLTVTLHTYKNTSFLFAILF